MIVYDLLGSEFTVNTNTTANQTAPKIAAFADGSFVIVWVTTDATQDGNSNAIKAQRFDASGQKVGGEFLVNNIAAGAQFTPGVAVLANGAFVVTWVSNDTTQDGSGGAIKARMFDGSGTALGGEFLVNTQTLGSQFTSTITALANGGFVIAWDDWNTFDRKAQIFDASGTKVGGEILVNTSTTLNQELGTVTALQGGGFVVSWRTNDTLADGSSTAAMAQIFDAAGNKVGGELRVNTLTTGQQNAPLLSALPGGGFVAAWETLDTTQDGSFSAVKLQVFDAAGNKMGAEVLANQAGFEAQRPSSIVTLPDGSFMVIWQSLDTAQDGSGSALKARVFSATGLPQGNEFLVNTQTSGHQALADAVLLGDGRLIIAWASDSGDGNGIGVRAQFFQPHYSPTIDSNGGGDTAAVTVGEGAVVATVIHANDPDTAAVSYSIVGGSDAAAFTIDPLTGVLSLVTAPDFEAPADSDGDNVYQVVVRASDGSLSDSQSIAIAVANGNEAPVIGSNGGGTTAALSIAENTAAVTVTVASDPDGTAPTYAIGGGSDAALFTIDPLTGALSFVTAPDFDAPADSDGDNTYEVTVVATDGALSDSQALSISVTGIDEAPTFTSFGGGASVTTAVAENSMFAGVPAASDPEGSFVTYAIVGGADAALFTLVPGSNAIRFLANPDFEAPGDSDGDNNYELVIRASDFSGHSTDQTVVISITDADEVPVFTSFGGASMASVAVSEGSLAVATLAAVDPDGEQVSFSVWSGPDSHRFAIDSVTGSLVFLSAPDYEQALDADRDNVYQVTVAADSGGTLAFQTILVSIGNVNEAPELTIPGSVSVAENGTTVLTLTSNDPENDQRSYTITGGADAARFTLDAVTGALAFIGAPNFEQPSDQGGNNVYDIVVSVSDGTFSTSQALAVTVTNVNEAPVITSNGGGDTASFSVFEGSSGFVTNVTSFDPDGGSRTYSISGGADAARFRIDETTGQLSFITPANFEAPTDSNGDNLYQVIVTASDGSLSDSQALSITVNNVNEGVAITSNGGGATATVTVNENTTFVTTVAALDGDGTAPTYAITGGADAARFTINALTGALSLISAPNFEAPTDSDGNNVYQVEVRASDGTFGDYQMISVTVGNVVDGVTLTGTSKANTLTGSAAEDTIDGLAGNDTLSGLAGADSINGGDGADTIIGGAGADILTGGLGADTFVFQALGDSSLAAPDLITDFSTAQTDKIGLSAIDANANLSGDQAFTWIGTGNFTNVAGQLRYYQSGGDTFVTGDVNGDGVGDFLIRIDPLVTLSSGSFVL